MSDASLPAMGCSLEGPRAAELASGLDVRGAVETVARSEGVGAGREPSCARDEWREDTADTLQQARQRTVKGGRDIGHTALKRVRSQHLGQPKKDHVWWEIEEAWPPGVHFLAHRTRHRLQNAGRMCQSGTIPDDMTSYDRISDHPNEHQNKDTPMLCTTRGSRVLARGRTLRMPAPD